MKKYILGLLFSILLIASVIVPAWAEPIHVNAYGTVQFSPKGGCTQALVERIGEARTEILVQAYSFTSKPIAQALLEAKQRGVAVHVLADASDLDGKGSVTEELSAQGVDVLYDDAHAIAHNKVMIFDRLAVATGSFNFTMAAEKVNAENLLILEDAGLAAIYARNWFEHREHSIPASMVGIKEKPQNAGKRRR